MTGLRRHLASFSRLHFSRLRFSLRPFLGESWRGWRWAVAGVFALLGLLVTVVYLSRPAPATDPARALTAEAQVYLQDAEVAARLAVLKTYLTNRRDAAELQPLYTSAADLLRTSHAALPVDSPLPSWADLEPTVTRLGVQLADGDAEAVTTLDTLLTILAGASPKR